MNVNSAPQPSSLPLRCADVTPYLSAYADGELAQPLRAQIAAHLETCESCQAQVARYAGIDAALMTLSRTAPSPAVFERIAAAVATHPNEPAVRESLRERRRLPLRRVIELQQWGEDDSAATPSPARRSRWAAAGLPAVAAILLVAFTAVALRGLGMHMPQVVTQPTCVMTGDPVVLTQSKMQTAMAGKTMNFTAVSPTYVPVAPTLRCVTAHVIADPSGNGALYLDVTWTLSGPVTQVHLREGPSGSGSAWYGYTPTNTSEQTWQVNANQWTPLAPSDGSGKLAVGEQRAGMWLAIDATPANGSSGDQVSAQNTLRLMSLSMDLPYYPMPVQSIIPAPTNLMYHLTGNLLGSSGTVDGYYEQAQHESHAEVQTSGSQFTDIIADQQGIRLDKSAHTYQQMQPASLIPATLDPFGQQIFYGADTDVREGLLWYVGLTKYKGSPAYDFLLVEAPRVTNVYVDASSKQVVAVMVDLQGSTQPGGKDAPSWFTNDGCIQYMLVEYVPQDPNVSFSPEPPASYHSGTVPSGIDCAVNAGQATNQ